MNWLKLIGKMIAALIGLVIGFMVVTFLVMAASVYIAYSNGQLQSWLSKQLKLDVTFQVAHVAWNGIHPAIEVKNILVLDQNKPLPSVRIDQAFVEFDILSSILHMKPVTDRLELSGLHLTMVQTDQSWVLQGVPPSQSDTSDAQAIWSWMYPQKKVAIRNAAVSLRRLDGTWLNLHDLNLDWYQKGGVHTLSLNFEVIGQGMESLNMKLFGDIDNFSLLNANYSGVLTSRDVSALLLNRSFGNLVVKQGSGKVAYWGQLKDGHIVQLISKLDVRNLVLFNKLTQAELPFGHISQKFIWQSVSNGGWEFILEPVDKKGISLSGNYFSLTESPLDQSNARRVGLQFDQVNLNTLNEIIQFLSTVPNDAQQALLYLHPHGSFKNVYIGFTADNANLSDFVFDADLIDYGQTAWQSWPSINNLSGNVHLSSDWGRLSINSPNLEINDQAFMPSALPALNVSAGLVWAKTGNAWQVQLNNMNLLVPGFTLSAQGKMNVPFDQAANASVNFLASIHGDHAEKFLPQYLPLEHIPPKLGWWLTHGIINSGNVDGVMTIRGKLKDIPYPNHQGVFGFYAMFNDASVLPWEGWPVAEHVNGSIHFDNHGFIAKVNNGSMDGVTINKVDLSVDDMRKDVPATFVIHGLVTAGDQGVRQYLLNSPLKSKFQELSQILQLQGNVGLDLTLSFPLAHSKNAVDKLEGVLSFNNNQIQLRALPLFMDHVNGNINFTRDTLDSDNLSAQFFGQPVNIGIATQQLANGFQRQVSVSTELDTAALAQVYPWAAGLSGNIPLSFKFVDNDTQNFFYLYGDFSNLASTLPAPLNKSLGMPLSLVVNGASKGNGARVHIGLGSLFRAKLAFKDDDNTGLSFVNGIAAIDQAAPLPAPFGTGLQIQGELPYISLESWVQYLISHNSTASSTAVSGKSFLDILPPTSLQIANADIYGQNYHHLKLGFTRGDQDTTLSLSSSTVQGSVLIPDQFSQTLQAKLDYLTLAPGKSSTALSSTVLKNIPPLDIGVKSLTIGNTLWGSVSLNTTPLDNGIMLNALTINDPNMKTTIKGVQYEKHEKDNVQLQGNLNAVNFGAALAKWGYNNFMTGGEGPINFNMSWQGAINSPVINSLNGNLNFNLKEGSLSDVNPGISRLLGLLNINSWWRRVQFNFSDVTGKGLSFDTLNADVKINNGVASTDNFELSGPGVVINSTGNIDLLESTIDQTLVVMPQTAGGLALVAGVVGGPVVGVATWVADSVLSNTVLKGKGLKYHVSGPLNKPEFTEE